MSSTNNYWIRKANSSRLSRRRFVGGTAMAGVGATAFSLVGCGDDDDDGNGNGDPTSTPNGGSTPSGSATPVDSNLPDHPMYRGLPGGIRGGKYQFSQSDTPVGRDPHAYEIPATQSLVNPVYNHLFMQWPDETPLEPVMYGELVEDWEQASDTEIVLTLRQGVMFQDIEPVSGREFTADDVVYNINRMQEDRPENRIRGFYTPITGAEAIDNYTVRLSTSEPYAALITNLAFTWAPMVARELVEAGDIDTRAIGTGGWILDEYEQGVRANYSRNPNYWKTGLPYFDEMEMMILPDAATREAQFLAGEIDNGAISFLGASPEVIQGKKDEIISRHGEDTNFRETDVSFNLFHLYFNSALPPFDNPDVRRAFLLAFPYDVLVNNLLGGYGRRTGPISAGNAFWTLPEAELPATNLEEAAALLDAAGFGDGIEVETWVSSQYSGTTLAQLVAGLYQNTGISVTPRQLENAQWFADVYRAGADYEISTHADATFDDPDRILHEYYHSEGAANHYNINDPEIDRLAVAQRQELDRDARQEIVLEMQRYIMEQAYEVPFATLGSISVDPPWMNTIQIQTGISDAYRIRDVIFANGGPRQG